MTTPTNDDPVIVRPALPDDMRFVSASWFESFWKASVRDTNMQYAIYKAGQDELIRQLCTRGRVTVVAATAAPDEIVGYVVREQELTHYVYVKQAYRRLGIAKTLLTGCRRYTHYTRAGERVAQALGMEFDPYALIRRLK